jgi:hypothetical protein
MFALSVLYAVLGNAVVYFILLRRGVPTRSLWAGTPFYLYRVCLGAGPTVGVRLRRFAYSTDIAFLAAMLLGLCLAALSR